ncbi:MAG TPA: choice-of-anchor J domain-containing protein, partial [Bacteroidales bacterium]|nr:choice-of-anchor J domain-containing protein [Bacteroidales bacterium]
ICPSDASESNDWIISPQLQMRNNGSISFWVYSPKPSTWGNETYDVLVSTTNNQPSSFTAIASNETAPNQWTQKTYSLSAYNNQAIYIAIRHRATDKFMMMIDDIVIDTGTVSSTNPVASFTYSPSNICQGTQVQFTNTSQNATSYSWSFPGGNPSTSTQTNPTVTFNTAGNINVTLIAHNGTISDTITQSVTINPLPTVSASANPSSICVGGSSVLSASGANTYNWSNGMNGSQITVSPSTTTTYTVTGTSTAGCTNTSTVMVNINTSINITATANPSNICLGGSTVLTANGGGSYSWSNSMTGSTITVSPTSTTTYSVTGSSGGCTGTATVSVTVNTLPAVSASANPSSICVGGSSVLSASGANTYNWSNGMNGSQITVSPATSSTYTVTGTNLNGCTNTATVSITVNALPTININANPQYICTGNSTVLSASGATSYNWSNGMTGSTITVYPTNTTIYTVTGTNSSNCSNTATISVTVETTPNAGTISASNTQLCQNDILTLTLNGYSPNSNIQWQISTDGTNWNDIAGATSSTYNYTFTSAGIYNFRAKVSNSCTSVYSDQIIITVNPLPTPGTASANITTICQNNSVILTLSGYSSGTTIQWQTSTNNISWNNISGANSAVYNYTPTNAGTIYIRAQVTNNCGSVFSNSITINVEAIPNGGIINSSSSTICQNDNVTLVLTGQTPMTSLQWQLSTDNITWFNISGANASNYNFIANNLGTYYYRVIVSNNCGTATSEEVSITVNPIPPTPTITLISSYPPILYSNATAGNQWYNVNGAIPGATNQTYQVIENGTYYVIVTQNNCQSLPSNVITIDNVSIESYNNNDVIVYPIPANDMIYIQTNKNISELQLIDAIGRVVIISNDSQIDVSNLSNGVYQLLIKSDNDRLILPVIIEK